MSEDSPSLYKITISHSKFYHFSTENMFTFYLNIVSNTVINHSLDHTTILSKFTLNISK